MNNFNNFRFIENVVRTIFNFQKFQISKQAGNSSFHSKDERIRKILFSKTVESNGLLDFIF